MKNILLMAIFSVSFFATASMDDVHESHNATEFVAEASLPADVLRYLLARIPNVEEVCTDALLQAIGDTWLGETRASVRAQCNGRETAAAVVIRDVAKLPASIWKSYVGTRVGGTEFFYDGWHLTAQVSKSVVKGTGLCLLYYKNPGSEGGIDGRVVYLISLVPNFLGEASSRYFVNAGKDYHLQKSEDGYVSYLYDNGLNSLWITASLLEAAFKVSAATASEEMWNFLVAMASSGQYRTLKMALEKGTFFCVNGVGYWIGAKPLIPGKSFSAMAELHQSGASTRLNQMRYFGLVWAASVISNIGITYTLAPFARTATDTVGDFYKGWVHPYIVELDQYFKTQKGEHEEL